MNKILEISSSFATHVQNVQQVLVEALIEVQSKNTTQDEIDRLLDVLFDIESIKEYIEAVTIEKISSFLPLNLPIYSILLFAIVPSFQAEILILKAPSSLGSLYRKLFNILNMEVYFPNIDLYVGERLDFFKLHCRNSDVVIFTGRPVNFQKIKKSCNRSTLLIFSGAGHNPFVLGPGANIPLGVTKILHTKLFNSGQDCAGADMVLVHESLIDKFEKEMIRQLKKIPFVSQYNSKNGRLMAGPLYERKNVLIAAQSLYKFLESGMRIIYGGLINLNTKQVQPTVLMGDILKHKNYVEQYSPLIPCASYSNDDDLKLYFADSGNKYSNNEMYISLFGESVFVRSMKKSIILNECSIHDLERGNYEYGGYGSGASAVAFKGLTVYKPLLIPQEIYHAFKKASIAQYMPKVKGEWHREIFASQFKDKLLEIFGSNLEFAYCFGSFAAGRYSRTSDIDTFICLRKEDPEAVIRYLKWISEIHYYLGRLIDLDYPAEIVTIRELKDSIRKLYKYDLQLINNPAWVYDAMVWESSLFLDKFCVINQENIKNHWEITQKTDNFYLNSFTRLGFESNFLKNHKSFVQSREGFLELLALSRLLTFQEDPKYKDFSKYYMNQYKGFGTWNINSLLKIK